MVGPYAAIFKIINLRFAFLVCWLMAKSVLKAKNYDIHAIGSLWQDRPNLNIAAWVMQTSMKADELLIALYQPDFTIESVRQSGLATVSLMAESQKRLVSRLGRKSGREGSKLNRLPIGFDSRGIPFLAESIGYLECEVKQWLSGSDHDLALCRVVRSVWLHPSLPVLTYDYLRKNKLVRG